MTAVFLIKLGSIISVRELKDSLVKKGFRYLTLYKGESLSGFIKSVQSLKRKRPKSPKEFYFQATFILDNSSSRANLPAFPQVFRLDSL